MNLKLVGLFLLKMVGTAAFGAVAGGWLAALLTGSSSYMTGIVGGVVGLVGFLGYQAYNTFKS